MGNINKVWLVKESIIDNKKTIVGAAEFVDDRRLIYGNFDTRYVRVLRTFGLTYDENYKAFQTKEEGNNFYLNLRKEGWRVGTESEYRKFDRKLMYS